MEYGIENKSESIDVKLLESFKCSKLGLRHISFKLSSSDGVVNVIKMNY